MSLELNDFILPNININIHIHNNDEVDDDDDDDDDDDNNNNMWLGVIFHTQLNQIVEIWIKLT